MKFARSRLTRRDALLLRLAIVASAAISMVDLLGVLLLAAVGVAIVNLVSLQGTAHTQFIGSLNLSVTAPWLVVMVGVATMLLAGKSMLAWLTTRKILRFIGARQVDFSSALFDRYLNAPYVSVVGLSTQSVIGGITSGSASIAILLAQNVSLVAEVVLVVGLSLLLLVASPILFIFTACYFGFLTVVIARFVGRRSQQASQASISASLNASQRASEIVGLAREVRVYGLGDQFGGEFRREQSVAALASAARESWSQVPRYVLETALLVGIALAAGIVVLTQSPDRAVFSLGLYLVSSTRLIPSIQRINGAWAAAKSALGSLVIVQPLLDLPGTLGDSGELMLTSGMSAKRQIPVGQRRSTRAGGGELRLTRVSFRYPNSDRDAVHDLTLAIPLGTRVAIVGHSGAGKSTLGDLMLGLLDPTSGDFRVVLRSEGDSTHSESGIHGLVTAFVSQDVYLAPTTIRANVALSVPGQAVDEEEVWQALRLAQVDDVVAALPEGVDTVLGERGARLSGGQRQRIGLARALFREPQMLVLDEATSSLDAQTEHSVTEAIEAIPGDITVVLIAHRLATVRSADLVLYLADGILIEAGSFDELVAHHPDLARSARLQGVG